MDTKQEAALATELLVEFSRLLGEQLDATGFPASPLRAVSMSQAFTVPKSQAYKILRGLAFPNLSNFVALRKMGVSMDEILDALTGMDPECTDLHIQDQVVASVLTYAKAGSKSQVAVVPRKGSKAMELVVTPEGQELPANARAIASIAFPRRPALAIIEDDKEQLELLARSAAKEFQVSKFPNASKFFKQDPDAFAVVLLDWNLPDMTGVEVIKRIRASSNVPVFILTGDAQASATIVKVMNERSVHHVAKPADALILNKRMKDAVNSRSR